MNDEVETPVESDVQPDAIVDEAPKHEDKPKRGRKPKSSAGSPATDSPARASEDASEELPAELPKRKFRCRIPKCHTLALEVWTEVEAVTAADAKEKYLAQMGIIALSEGKKVEAEAL